MPRFLLLSVTTCLFTSGLSLVADAQVTPRRDIERIYRDSCADCHGRNLQGGLAPSLLDGKWTHGSTDEDLARIIRDGVPDAMDGFKGEMSEAEIRAMVVYIREHRAGFTTTRQTKPLPAGVVASEEHEFRLEIVADGLSTPWAIDFLPDGRMLVTEKPGRLRVIENGRLQPEPVHGIPAVRDAGQGGLLEVAVHPRYAENGWIYLAYSDPALRDGQPVSLTTLVRGRLRDGAWVDQETIWRAPLEHYRAGGGVHYGCRIAFDREGYLYFSHGERGRQDDAQDLRLPVGKIHRLHDDGRVPADNPFVGHAGAFASVWTYGNRNPQGLDFDPRTGLLWETEHGPRGGDELNLIHRGANYGWPLVTHGMNYNGTPITPETSRPGIEPPVVHWTPSIAVCGIDFYTGEKFPRWRHHLFVTALAQQELRRVVIAGERVTHQEVVLRDIGRLRDVANGPDGFLYLAVNQPDRIVRLVPAE
ncbi:MAG: PQQ-dependent sugar dehydrogenase [Candidatus Didemnitutus sp.]|nr:PQQ-dependent sugar dehydrogenase [Candidatus Didemnitutus sp.]